MISENAIDMETIKSLLPLKYRNKRHEAATAAPLMQPQPVRSPERCRREEPKTKAAGRPEKLNQRHQSKKGSSIISGAKGKHNEILFDGCSRRKGNHS